MAHASNSKLDTTNNIKLRAFLNGWLERTGGSNIVSSAFNYSGKLLRKQKRNYSLANKPARGRMKMANDDYKKCAHCGKVITNGRGARRVYCNQACKQAAWRERKEQEAQAGLVTLACDSNKGSQ